MTFNGVLKGGGGGKEINEKLPITHTSTLFESLFVEVWRKSSIYKKDVIGNRGGKAPLSWLAVNSR